MTAAAGLAPRPESRAERVADAAVHALGLALGAAGCAALAAVVAAGAASGAERFWAAGLYGAGLMAMLVCSAVYNLAPEGSPRKLPLRRLDHAAIFVMIAATYTPVALLGLGGGLGWALFGAVWGAALVGVLLKLLAPLRFERLSLLSYLALGWAGAPLLGELLGSLTGGELALLAAGGLTYTVGVPFHVSERLPGRRALWHACVLLAAGFHYAMVLRLVAGGGGGDAGG